MNHPVSPQYWTAHFQEASAQACGMRITPSLGHQVLTLQRLRLQQVCTDVAMAAGSSEGNGRWGMTLPDLKEIYLGTLVEHECRISGERQ